MCFSPTRPDATRLCKEFRGHGPSSILHQLLSDAVALELAELLPPHKLTGSLS